MANNIGLDFGTTYSVISHLKKVKRDGSAIKDYELEAYSYAEGKSACQDSIVVRNEKNTPSLLFGQAARNKVGMKGYQTYKGFKMMLSEEPGSKNLVDRGYTEDFTPYRATSVYIENLLNGYVDGLNLERLDKVVVGVPEIWFEDNSTMDCREILEGIISGFENVGEVQVVSEPAAACAFFVENYRKNKNKKYAGKILLVDYGGGTLDIALCDVKANGESSEVSVIKRCGAGVNGEEFIGKAGLAYIELVTKILFRNIGMTDEEIINHRKFNKWMHEVENALMNHTSEIKEIYRCTPNQERKYFDEDYIVDTFEYAEDEEISITYAALTQAYEQLIAPVLGEKLKEILEYMDSHGIEYGAERGEEFKIAPVGGFCNFYLVQEQIEKVFGHGPEDKRFEDIINDRSECEKAISYGAALIANNIIDFKQLAPYHLGIAGGDKNQDDPEIFYAIHKGDDIVYDEPVFIKEKNGKEDMIFGGNRIPLFAFSTDDADVPSHYQLGEPLQEYKDALKLDENQIYKIGISFDKSMIISVHKHTIKSPEELDIIVSKSKVKLTDIRTLLGGLTRVRRK